MLLPIGTDRPSTRPVTVTPLLIGMNIAMFMAQQVIGSRDPEAAERLFRPLYLHPGAPAWYQPLTSAFLHAGLWHILGNMIFLWVFGPNIEDRLGRWWFLLFYIAGAYAAGGAHLAFERSPALGASGAVAACTGAYLVLFPRTQIKAIFFLVMGVVWVSAWWFIGASIVWDLFGHARGGGRIAYLAHLGGYAYGMGVSLVLLWTRLIPRETYDLFSIGKQAYRRRQMREAAIEYDRNLKRKIGAPDGKVRRAAPSMSARVDRSGGGGEKPGSAPKPDAHAEALALARSGVIELLSAERLDEAAAAYRKLVDTYADAHGATTLSLRYQERLAMHLYTGPDKALAAYAIERLVEAYPRDPATPRFKLLLGLLNSRELNDPVRAKAMLTEAAEELQEESERAMATRELAALG